MSARERFLYLYLFLLVHVVAIEETTAAVCEKINDCECKRSNGKVMSLKPIDGSSGPKFLDIEGSKPSSNPPHKFTLSWNPCTPFSDNDCKNVLLCQKDGGSTNPIAQNASTFTEKSDGSITLTYQAVKYSDYTRIGVINLSCDKDEYPGKFDPFVEVEDTAKKTGTYTATFHSKCVCDEGCSGGGLSTGSILLIVFFVLLLVYLIAGLLYKRFHKGVQSMPEMIPNYSFWADFPFLIKDGCVFTFQGLAACCKRCCMKLKSDSYASI